MTKISTLQDALSAAATLAATDNAYLFRLIANPLAALADVGYSANPLIRIDVIYEEFKPVRFRIDFSKVALELTDDELELISAGATTILIWPPDA